MDHVITHSLLALMSQCQIQNKWTVNSKGTVWITQWWLLRCCCHRNTRAALFLSALLNAQSVLYHLKKHYCISIWDALVTLSCCAELILNRDIIVPLHPTGFCD